MLRYSKIYGFKIKRKNHKIISISGGKSFDKIQYSLMIKLWEKIKIEGNFSTCQRSSTKNSQLTLDRRSEPRQRCYVLTILTQHLPGTCSQCNNKARNGNKRHIDRKEEVKLSLFSDDKIIYVENPQNPPKKFF